MAKTKALDAMSDDELMEAWGAVGEEVAAGKERLREFSQEHQRRTRKAQLAHLAGMSDEDLALLQEVRSEGVESEEAVNTDG